MVMNNLGLVLGMLMGGSLCLGCCVGDQGWVPGAVASDSKFHPKVSETLDMQSLQIKVLVVV